MLRRRGREGRVAFFVFVLVYRIPEIGVVAARSCILFCLFFSASLHAAFTR